MSDRKTKRGLPLIHEASETLLGSNTDAPVPEEWKRAAEKINRQQEAISKAQGFGATAPAQAIARKWLPELAQGIERALAVRDRSPVYSRFLAVIRDLSPELLALCFLQTALHSIGQREKYRDTALNIGAAIAGECWAAELTEIAPDLAKRIETQVRQKHAATKRRQQAARAQAARAGYRTNDWSTELRLQAGCWSLNQLLTILPGVFVTINESQETGGPERVLTLTSDALAYARGTIADLIRRNPVWLPVTNKPPCWTDWDKGGTSDKRLSLSLRVMRSYNKNTAAAVREAIRKRTMQPTLNALNALQSTAWTINNRVRDVLHACIERGIDVPGLPLMTDLPAPRISAAAWESRDADALRLHSQEAEKVKQQNRRNLSNRVLLIQDLETADMLVEHDRFWTPMNLDWRGRVYGVPSFNFQRDDRVRALFLFADGEPIGDEGLYWLKVHVANCGDFNKISKRPFEERVQWVNNNLETIERIAAEPLKELKWKEADKPFQFLAACLELSSALANGPTFVSRLPISFDGSCSGLQHLSAMMRDSETAKLVNLMPSAVPQDIYQTVAECVNERIKGDLKNEHKRKRQLAQMCLGYGIDRKLVKRNVMTYSYSSNVRGMAEQLREDVMLPLSLQNEPHPFGNDDGFRASWYLAQQNYAAIKGVVRLPAQAMAFLQRLARAMAYENKPLRWASPAGVPWINQYTKPQTKQVKLWLHDGLVRIRYTTKIVVGELPQIEKGKAASAVAPNFVHALDAAHLLRTVNEAVAEGISSIATVHDSFGCLPSRAARFRRLIREEFVRMYTEHDVLAEVYEQARADLSDPDAKRMPSGPPQKGSLEIEQLLDAEFAFA